MFLNSAPGQLVDISGNDPNHGDWRHKAFVPDSLPDQMPDLFQPEPSTEARPYPLGFSSDRGR